MPNKSLNASDLPIKFEQLETQFRLPNSAKLNAGINFNPQEATQLPVFTKSVVENDKKKNITCPSYKHTEYKTLIWVTIIFMVLQTFTHYDLAFVLEMNRLYTHFS